MGGGGGADGGDEGLRHFGFVEAGDGAEGLGDFLGEFVDPDGHGDDAARVLADFAADVGGGHAVGDGHVQVHDEDVWRVGFDEAEGFGVVDGFGNDFDIGGRLEDAADGAADGVEIVGDDDFDGHGTCVGNKGRSGAAIRCFV
jgi:hypothetical protein